MHEHHRQAIEELTAQVEGAAELDALILAGSVARGTARPDSDIDCYLVVGDDEYERRAAANDLAWFAPCGYPGGYVDGKIITVGFLELAAARGSEPTRASFVDAVVAWSRNGDLTGLVEQIGTYPEANRAANLRDFFAAAALHASYFGPQAIQKQDPFLRSHAAAMSVLFGGRAVLAHNRLLFPCPKQLLATLEAAPDKPAGFLEAARSLLEEPTEEGFARLLSLLQEFTDWGISGLAVLTRFMELDEWSWRTGEPELAQR